MKEMQTPNLTSLSEQLRNNLREWLVSQSPGGSALPYDIACDISEQRSLVQIISKGLSLDDKAQIEQQIKRYPQFVNVAGSLRVDFRKAIGSDHGTDNSAPAPRSRVANPFGLKIAKRNIPGVKHIIAVASGKGGVGKSTVASNLAVALAKSNLRVGLLDADIYGPSAPTMFGLDGPMLVDHSSQKLQPLHRYGVAVASFGFLSDVEDPVIWRGPLVSKAFEQFCFDVDWSACEILVLDLPPGTGDIQLTMIERLNISQSVIVSTPQDVALIDAHKAVSMFQRLEVPILGLVENMAMHRCTACGHEERIFGDEAGEFSDQRGIKILGSVPLNARIRRNADLGVPVASLEEDDAKVFFDIAHQIKEALNEFPH